MRTPVALIVGFLAGLLCAWAMRPLWGGSEPEAAPPLESKTVAAPVAGVPAERPADLEAPRKEAAPTIATEERVEANVDDVLIGEALWTYAEEGIARGWSGVRRDPIPMERIEQGSTEFEETVLAAPALIGRALGASQTAKEAALEDARSGGAFGLLAAMMEGAGPVPELVGDATAFGELFPREFTERAVPVGASLRGLGKTAEDGVTWALPAGVFELGDILSAKTPFPRDVTLAGAGMDSTLIVLRTDLGAHGDLRRLAIRDCTFYTYGNYFFDHRQGAATFVMDRVRVVGFDKGSGSSCAFALRDGVAMYVRDCRFEGGYGGHPSSGTLFDLRHPAVVARFESCAISTTSVRVDHLVGGATVVFANCQLFDMLNDVEGEAEGREGILFPGTVIHRRDPADGAPPELDLNDLFPDWEQRLQR